MWCRWEGTYGKVKEGSPYTVTSGAPPFSRMQMLRASSMASWHTPAGLHLVSISPMWFSRCWGGRWVGEEREREEQL